MDWFTQRSYTQAKLALGWWVTRFFRYMGYFATGFYTCRRGLWGIKNIDKEMA